jgi:hypothetical protein
MTELQLHKFIVDHSIEFNWNLNKVNRDVIAFIDFYSIKSFAELLGTHILSEGGVKCRLKDGYLAIWMEDICEYHGILIENVFGKDPDPNE